MGIFILILLNILFPLVALGVVIAFLISPRRHVLKTLFNELNERFVIKSQVTENSYIWFHAASVGEVKSIVNLAVKLKEEYKLPILITTTTLAGRDVALKYDVYDKCLLAPLDFSLCILRFLKFYNPKLLLIVEADLWPNMLYFTSKKGVKIGIINGRLSARSAKRYKLLKPLVNLIFDSISFICAQYQEIAQRYIDLGATKDKVFCIGNIKYDTLQEQPKRQEEAKEIIKKLNWESEQILVCGSTHPEEENIIFNTAQKIKNIKIIFAPRHLERKSQIIENLKKRKLSYTLLSNIDKVSKDIQVLFVDTMGLLGALYSVGNFAFVGGSIVKKGGHNFLEPAILKKFVLFGKYYFNTPDTAQALLSCKGACLVNKKTFAEVVSKYAFDNDLLNTCGISAYNCALTFKGATQKTFEVIKNYGTK